MYKGFGEIVCDQCHIIVNDLDYIILKDKKVILHYCSEKCKKKHQKQKK